MMKRISIALSVFGLSMATLCAADFSNVTCRQLWPFSSNVEVRFTAANVTGLLQLQLQVSEGTHVLGTVPAGAFRNSSAVVDADGDHRLAFDPSAVPCLAARGMLKDLRVTITSTALAESEVLYYIFDLSKSAGTEGAKEFVTRAALTGGAWGAWEETIWPNVTAVKTPVWTGVTNDTKYALTHLVMRRIDAGSFNFGFAADADVRKEAEWNNYTQRVVRITKPYYIGVYEFTAKQIRLLTGSADMNNLMRPTVNDSFDRIRGAYTKAGAAYDWPTDRTVDPESYIGKLRARTGVAFDLPTDAQWEKAARAGSDGVYYDGCAQTHLYERNAIAWNKSNCPTEEECRNPKNVGLLKPNNYGLYDTLGNVWEWVLDWRESGSFDYRGDDPLGPTAAGAGHWLDGYPKRVLRGASLGDDYTRVTLHEHTQNAVCNGAFFYGWRVAMPATEE